MSGNATMSVASAAGTGVEEGEITLVNTAVEEVFGYDREELIGRSIDVLIPDRLAILHPSQGR